MIACSLQLSCYTVVEILLGIVLGVPIGFFLKRQWLRRKKSQ